MRKGDLKRNMDAAKCLTQNTRSRLGDGGVACCLYALAIDAKTRAELL